MVANIEVNKETGEASFFSAREVAWHGLGTVTEDVLTAQEALETAHLDWEVFTRPVHFTTEDDTVLAVPDRYAVVRESDNKPLGIVGGDYKIFQNADVFSFFDTVVDSGEAKYETAGSLQGGAKVFITAKIGEQFLVNGEDAHDMYLLMTTSHDGTQSFRAVTTMIRAVCQNTVTMAINGAKSKWTLRHKTNLAGKTQEARESLGLAFKYQDAFEAEVAELMAVEVEKDEFMKMVSSILPDQKRKKERNVEELMSIFETEPTVVDAPGAGTGWGAYNAWTFWADHVKESRSEEARFKAAMDESARSNLRSMILANA